MKYRVVPAHVAPGPRSAESAVYTWRLRTPTGSLRPRGASIVFAAGSGRGLRSFDAERTRVEVVEDPFTRQQAIDLDQAGRAHIERDAAQAARDPLGSRYHVDIKAFLQEDLFGSQGRLRVVKEENHVHEYIDPAGRIGGVAMADRDPLRFAQRWDYWSWGRLRPDRRATSGRITR